MNSITSRKHYIDNIRWITVCLVVIYHVVFIFNSVVQVGTIGAITPVQYQDGLLYVLYPWFMVLLFIIAGICSREYLNNHSSREFISSRTTKLLVPSTIGVMLFGWMQGYFSMRFSGAFANMPDTMSKPIILFLIMALSGISVQWFSHVLWLLSVLLILVRRFEKGRLYGLCGKISLPIIIALVLPLWGFAHILNVPMVSVYRFGIYGFAFFTGYFIFCHENVVDKLARIVPVTGIISAALAVIYLRVYLWQNYAAPPVVNSPLSMLFCWSMCLFALGAGKRWLDFSTSFTAFMTKRSYGIYLLHYLMITVTAFLIATHTNIVLPPIIIYLIVAVAGFAGAIVLNKIISRIPFLRWCILGIKKN